jgi:hypothetical protein
LDPWIRYAGLLADCWSDLSMQRALKCSRKDLQDHYQTYYALQVLSTANPTPAGPPIISGSPQKVDFISWHNTIQEIGALTCWQDWRVFQATTGELW